MNKLAMITARGGSKRIPRKNIKDFMGKPMLAYALESALKSDLFDEVMVSTDDEEIAEIARQYGAKIPFMRSAKTADDFATTSDVVQEVLVMYKEQGKNFDEFCCIYPCVPFLTAEILKNAYKEFQGHSGLVPVCKYSTPIERCLEIKEGKLSIWNEEAFWKRSQDLEPKYFDVGMFYFSTLENYQATKNLTLNAKPFIMQEKDCQDIDTLEDWEFAEMKYKILKNIN